MFFIVPVPNQSAHRDYGIKMRPRIHWILVSTVAVILAGCDAATEVSARLPILGRDTIGGDEEREREKRDSLAEIRTSRGSKDRGRDKAKRPRYT